MRDFEVPDDGIIYARQTVDRCVDLIYHGIWAGIDQMRLRRWLSNFSSNEEKYFAACVLDSLIYRSEDQTIALVQQLFQRTLPDLNRLDAMPIAAVDDWTDALKKNVKIDPGLRFVTVARRSDSPTKSAYYIARLLKRYLFIDERWIIQPEHIQQKITQGIDTFLFIDDFLGTGTQFIDFFELEQLEQYLPDIYAAYVPLVAHTTGMFELRKRFPALRVVTVEMLDSSHSLFNSGCNCFIDGLNTPDSAKQFYYDLLRRKKIEIRGPNRRGFGHLELSYVFSHAAPDNSLPILWWPYSDAWSPLFNR